MAPMLGVDDRGHLAIYVVLSASLAALAEMFPYDEIVATLMDQRAVPHDLARAHTLVSERGAY